MVKEIDEIKKNNFVINDIIKRIISSNKEEAFVLDDDGKYVMSDTFKKIIELEMDKISKIYHMEFPELPFDDTKSEIVIYDGAHMDACFDEGKLKFSTAIKREFEELKKGKIYGEELGYRINEDGKVTYDRDGKKDKIKPTLLKKSDGMPYMYNNTEAIENDFGFEEEMLYFYLNDSNYVEFLFLVLPHEMAHKFGFGSGLFEGLTENIAREVSFKYGISTFPSARLELVKRIQKIEKIIGRDELVKCAHTFNGSIEDIQKLSNLIDQKLGGRDEDLFKKLYDTIFELDEYQSELEKMYYEKYLAGEISKEEVFEVFRNDEKLEKLNTLRVNAEKKFDFSLNEYINNNPTALYELGSTNMTLNKENVHDVIEHQTKEIDELSNILKNLKQTKDNEFKDRLHQMVNTETSFESGKSNYELVPTTDKKEIENHVKSL